MDEKPAPVTAPSVRDGYDRWAAVYDHDSNPLVALEEPVVHQLLGDVARLRVLDLGCGTGRHTSWLASHGARVTAVDFSQGMLDVARHKLGGAPVDFVGHDLHHPLPFPDGTFDLVVSGLVLEHLRELTQFFSEAHRVLTPTGRAVISAMHPAMFLRGSQARFTDPESGDVVMPGSYPHQVSDFVMSAIDAGFRLTSLIERAPEAAFAERYPRALKYIGWPMLAVLNLSS